MADTKISALAALLGVNVASGDRLVIVDVSDTSMAASGTDHYITADELATALIGGTTGESIIRQNSLDQLSPPAANLSMNSKRLTTLADPVNPQDGETLAHTAATYQLLDPDLTALAQGGGWLLDTGIWKFASAGTATTAAQFAVATDETTRLTPGTKVSWNDGSVKYGVIGSSSFLPAAPITSVTTDVSANTFGKTAHGLANGTAVIPTGMVTTTGITNGTIYYVVSTAANTFQLALTVGGSAIDLTGSNDSAVVTITGATLASLLITDDYTITNATISAPRYSYAVNPQAFPSGFNWTPTLVGWSANPTTTANRWTAVGRLCMITISQGANGTSNATGHTASLPVSSSGLVSPAVAFRGVDNGTTQTGVATVSALTPTVVNLACIIATGVNTNSGNNRVIGCQISYEF